MISMPVEIIRYVRAGIRVVLWLRLGGIHHHIGWVVARHSPLHRMCVWSLFNGSGIAGSAALRIYE